MNSRISIGDETPTGEPANGPAGPYITADDDGTHANKKKQPLEDGTARQTTASKQGTGWQKRAEHLEDAPDASDAVTRGPKGPAQP